MPLADPSTLEREVERLLACPRCHGPLEVSAGRIRCRAAGCGGRGEIAGGVVLIGDHAGPSSFDDTHEVMQQGNEGEGVRCLCYDKQARLVERHLRPGMVILDVGCGPAPSYTRPAGSVLIGLDPSRESLRSNTAVDLRVHGTATALPLPGRSLDAILCFYSIHHMVGSTVAENRAIVSAALRELARTLRPGGSLFIFEVSPWRPFWLAELSGWNLARRLLGARLDMFFWSAGELSALVREVFRNATLRVVPFPAPLLSTFPPAFRLPWLKVPRALYPFDVNLYQVTV